MANEGITVKRSYGQTSSGPAPPVTTQPAATAPLPPGPPPPVPAVPPNPYAAYGYGPGAAVSQPQPQQMQPAAHPQYPGYGYGGQQQQPLPPQPSPYQNYSTPGFAPTAGVPAYPYPAQPGVPQPQALPPNPYAAYGTPQVYQQQQPVANGAVPQYQAAYQQQYATVPVQYQQQGVASPLPPQQYQQALQSSTSPFPGAPQNPGLPSPQGAPPFKRTRYEQQQPAQQMGMQMAQPMAMGMQQQHQQQQQPPPALPPLNGAAGGFSGRGRGRGAGGMGRGGSHFGGGQQQMDFAGGAQQQQFSTQFAIPAPPPPPPGMMQMGSGPMSMQGGGQPMAMGMGMSMVRGPAGFDSRSSSGRGRGSAGGPPLNAPFGPASTSTRGSSRGRGGSFADRGRPVSGLPGSSSSRGGYGAGARSTGSDGGFGSSKPSARLSASSTHELPKGPRAGRTSAFGSSGRGADSNSREPRKERKWGNKDSGRDAASERGKEEARRTLTDFRISALKIPEIDWEWLAEKAKAVVANAEKGKKVEEPLAVESEEEEEEVKIELDEDEDDEDDDEAETPVVNEEISIKPEPDEDDDQQSPIKLPPSSPPSQADMSVDTIAPSTLDELSDSLETSESTAPKKKLSKKQKRAEAAVKRAATLAEKASANGDEAPASSSTVAKKSKHGRDDEEENLVITDVTAKKVKADTGEIVTLENIIATVAPIPPPTPTPTPVPPPTSTPAPMEDVKPIVISLPSSLPAKPNLSLPAKPRSLPIPTGPAADQRPPTPAPAPPPPSNRENSRLRIYFSSPVSPANHPNHQQPPPPDKSGSRPPSVKESTPALASVAPEVSALEAIKEPESTVVKVEAKVLEKPTEGDDVDGEALDGDPVPSPAPNSPAPASEPAGQARTVATEESDQDDTDDEVQSALLANSKGVEVPVGTEESSAAAEVGVKDEPVEENVPTGHVQDTEVTTAPTEAGPAATPLEVETDVLPPAPSADRISISYARNTRRMVLDAEVVEKVTVYRSEGRIEILVNVQPATLGEGEDAPLDPTRVCKGVLVEALDVDADEYVIIERTALEAAWGSNEPQENDQPESLLDPHLPPLHHLLTTIAPVLEGGGVTVVPGFKQSTLTIIATLDRSNPLTEARWVKTGEVESWIASLGVVDSKKPGALSEWKGKITVSDPDPPPTIQHALDSWATSSTISSLEERKAFVADHMSNIDNVFEILLRLTRGDRSGSSHYSASAQPSSVGALAATLSAPYAEHQTQVSLAVLAMFRLSVETAAKAGIPKKEVEKQVAEIVRGIPFHLMFKSLDGMFRERRSKARGH